MKKNGIALIGTCVIDELVPVVELGKMTYVDAIRFVPESEIVGEHVQLSVGGLALNVAVNLSKIAGDYPIRTIGKLGNDHRANIAFEIFNANNLDTNGLIVSRDHQSSWTEVMNIKTTDGQLERIFRHRLGAMGSFTENDIDFESLKSFKIAHVGYGLLLPQLDLYDDKYGTKLGKVLSKIQALDVKTCLDFVSPNDENMFKFLRYKETIKYTDILCINEDQASALTDEKSPDKACENLVLELGARLAVVHCGSVGPNYAFSQETGLLEQPNFVVNECDYKGNAGAGDAFASGFLHGYHQDWDIKKSLKFAAASAAISLNDVSCTGAMQNEQFIIDYMDHTPTR